MTHREGPLKEPNEAPHKEPNEKPNEKLNEVSHEEPNEKPYSEAPRLLAIYGSPRKGGNTDILLDHFLEGVSSSNYVIERVYLRDLHFSPCTECDGCVETGKCIMHDDMDDLYAKLLEDERVVFAFPVFFLGPPAIAKAFIDRAQALWVRRFVIGVDIEKRERYRKGFFLSLAGFRGSVRIFSCSISIVRSFYAACGIRYTGELTLNGVDRKGDIERNSELLEMAKEAGRRFVK